MAEWVQKGNLKGPQGDPGQDAQLPAGGTEGQVLTKTSGGESWADVPQPDMTGVVKKASLSSGDQYTALSADGSIIDSLVIGNESSGEMVAIAEGMIQAASEEGSLALSPSTIYAASSKGSITVETDRSLYLLISSGQHTVGFSVSGSSAGIQFDSKSVTSITDSISASPAGNALTTDKAVADYVTANAPSVTIPLPVSQGGTGATTAEGARTALGIPDIEVATDEEFDSYMGLS